MTHPADHALWTFEERTQELLAFVKAAGYGLRLAVRRVGELTSVGGTLPGPKGGAGSGMRELSEALASAEDRLSDLLVLALGDHFRAFLARALALAELPALPATAAELEELAGAPGVLRGLGPWVPRGLQLYRVALRGGGLDRATLEALGSDSLELVYPGGKVRMYREGDHVCLAETQVAELAEAFVEAAKALRRRLQTS